MLYEKYRLIPRNNRSGVLGFDLKSQAGAVESPLQLAPVGTVVWQLLLFISHKDAGDQDKLRGKEGFLYLDNV